MVNLMLEVVGSSQKRSNFQKFFKTLLINFRLTTVINLHQTIPKLLTSKIKKHSFINNFKTNLFVHKE